MKVITTGLLNRFWTKGIKPWLDKRIKSYADLMVTTASGYTPDALAVKEGFTELNGNLDTKIQIITLSEKTGTDSNSGIIYIPKTSYPDAKCIIPFAYDSTLTYRIGIFDVSTNSFRFAVQTAVNGKWADSKTITFSALIIK